MGEAAVLIYSVSTNQPVFSRAQGFGCKSFAYFDPETCFVGIKCCGFGFNPGKLLVLAEMRAFAYV